MAAENRGKYASLLTKEPKPLRLWSGQPFLAFTLKQWFTGTREWLIKLIRTTLGLLSGSPQRHKSQMLVFLLWCPLLFSSVKDTDYSEWWNTKCCRVKPVCVSQCWKPLILIPKPTTNQNIFSCCSLMEQKRKCTALRQKGESGVFPFAFKKLFNLK